MRSDSSTSSAESEDSEEDSKKLMRKYGTDYRISTPEDIAPTLLSGSKDGGFKAKTPHVVLDASGQTTGTNTPIRSTPQGSGRKGIIQATLGRSGPVVSPITTFSVLASLARLSVLPEKGGALKTLVERFSSRLPVLRGLKDPHYYSWRMSKDSSATTKGRPTQPSWKSWGVSAIGQSGRFSTLSGSVYPRTGSACSLSDILEEEVPDQYFLSQKLVKTLTKELNGKRAKLVSPSEQGLDIMREEPTSSTHSTKRRDRT